MPVSDNTHQCKVDTFLALVHEESYSDEVFRDYVLGEHMAPWLRLRAHRAIAPRGLKTFDREKVHETSGNTTDCKCILAFALNTSHVLFATARMVASRHRLLLVAATRKAQMRFAFCFVHEAWRHNSPVGWGLAAMGSQKLMVTLGS